MARAIGSQSIGQGFESPILQRLKSRQKAALYIFSKLGIRNGACAERKRGGADRMSAAAGGDGLEGACRMQATGSRIPYSPKIKEPPFGGSLHFQQIGDSKRSLRRAKARKSGQDVRGSRRRRAGRSLQDASDWKPNPLFSKD